MRKNKNGGMSVTCMTPLFTGIEHKVQPHMRHAKVQAQAEFDLIEERMLDATRESDQERQAFMKATRRQTDTFVKSQGRKKKSPRHAIELQKARENVKIHEVVEVEQERPQTMTMFDFLPIAARMLILNEEPSPREMWIARYINNECTMKELIRAIESEYTLKF